VTIQMKAIEPSLSCGTVYYALQRGSDFLSLWMKP